LFESTETTRIREEELVLGPKQGLPRLVGERPRDDVESGALVLRAAKEYWCLAFSLAAL
jgi:hypothetical protein